MSPSPRQKDINPDLKLKTDIPVPENVPLSPHITTIVVSVCAVAALLILISFLVKVFYRRFDKESKVLEVQPVNVGGHTYTNASHTDFGTDRKPFTWKRLHHDNPQVREY